MPNSPQSTRLAPTQRRVFRFRLPRLVLLPILLLPLALLFLPARAILYALLNPPETKPKMPATKPPVEEPEP